MVGLASIRERHAILVLIVLWIVTCAFVAAHPHSFERPTVPDERSYYGWALLYREGRVAVPLSDWFEVRLGLDVYANGTAITGLDVETERALADGVPGPATVRVAFGGRPAVGAIVRISASPFRAVGTTDAAGEARFPGAPPGPLTVDATYERFPEGEPPVLLGATDRWSPADREPYGFRAVVESMQPAPTGGRVVLQVEDSFGTAIPGVRVFILPKTPGAQPREAGTTNGTGRVAVDLDGLGSLHLGLDRAGARDGIPIASVVQVNGEWAVVSRWPAGYSVLLAGLLTVGAEGAVGFLMSAMAGASAYVLGRRLFGWRAGFLAAVLLLASGIALMMVFSKGMADYASMAFALLGVALVAEAAMGAGAPRRRLVLAFAAGVAFGAAIWMRYSTATVLVAPAALGAATWLLKVREKKGWGTATKEFLRVHGSVILAFLLGLAPLAGALAAYNATYFGDPFGAGYTHGGTILVTSDGNNSTAEISGGTFFGNFNPGASLDTMAPRVAWLVLLVPFLLLAPYGVWLGRRALGTLLLVAFLLSNLLLYLFVPWVGTWADATRSMEDMRYFLVSVPPAAVLTGLALVQGFRRVPWRKVGVAAIVALLVAAGFAGAELGIERQLNRLQGPPGPPPPPPPPPPSHIPATVGALAADPLAWNNSLVSVRNLTFVRSLNPTAFLANDSTYPSAIAVLLVGYPAPALSPGDLVDVQGMFRWTDGNGDGVVQAPELSIGVKGGTTDGIVVH